MFAARTHTVLLSCALALAAVACKFDYPLEGRVASFSCYTTADCEERFLCTTADDPDLLGECVSVDIEPHRCEDDDGDNTFVGPGCIDQLIDCDDGDASVNPLATESCDGVDNNCTCDRTAGDSNGDGTVCGPGDDGVDEDQPDLPCPLGVGMCSGTRVSCVNGSYANCIDAGLYGPDFEINEQSCDGIDNDCDNKIDEGCDCIPGEDLAFECGTGTGACTRGVQLCLDDGSLSSCVAAGAGFVCANGDGCGRDADCVDGSECTIELCETDEDCGAGGLCIVELLDDREDLFDDCTADSALGCDRNVCRYLTGTTVCATDEECAEGEVCFDELCEPVAIGPLEEEICNGLDDNCDGRIDDDFNRRVICGPCPFNMEFLPITTPTGQADFVCVDWYEAARPDATAGSAGTLEHYAVSAPGVLPWTGLTPDLADSICRAEPYRELAGGATLPVATKRLCKTYEWQQGCGGKRATTEETYYPYTPEGEEDVFIPGACIDGSIGTGSPAVTGSAPECCKNNVCDAVGNVAEFVTGAGNAPLVAGGSFNDNDPDVLSCGDGSNYAAVPADVETRNDIGFRCCTLPPPN